MRTRAVLFDLDGTLYRQGPLRALMAAELGVKPWVRHVPTAVPRLWRVLRTFRQVREELRTLGHAPEPLSRLQYDSAAERTGVPVREVENAVAEWILRRPLTYMHLVRRAGLQETLGRLQAAGLQIGVFSDYPTREKLAALGVQRFFSLELCATDEDINAFKPHPRGFVRACERWGLAPGEVLYVGDRPETDAAGAAAAGMACVIVNGARTGDGHQNIAHLGDIVRQVVSVDAGPHDTTGRGVKPRPHEESV